MKLPCFLICLLGFAAAGILLYRLRIKKSPADKPECIGKIDLKDFGGMVARFGDLNGDGTAEALFVQSSGQNITCLTAIDLNGNLLWQRGRADVKNRTVDSDLPVQIYDWDHDGINEVIVVEDKTLRILDGRTGQVRQEAAVGGMDSILIANFSGTARPNDLLIKDRYNEIWVYDQSLKLQWSRKLGTGHYPMNIDLDGDGHDELICGDTLFNHDGTIRAAIPGLDGHNDAVDADDMDGDGRPEIAIAAGSEGVLLNADGEIIWRRKHRHIQHAIIGAFVPGQSEKQVVFVDRIHEYSRDGGTVYCYDKKGNRLWRTAPHGPLTIASTMDNWTGEKNQSFILLYRRSAGPPVLLDGRGKIVAEFPFPPAKRDTGWEQYFVQHFDALGDAREEVFVYNTGSMWIYRNPAPPPPDLPKPLRGADPRIYNASFYVGRQ